MKTQFGASTSNGFEVLRFAMSGHLWLWCPVSGGGGER